MEKYVASNVPDSFQAYDDYPPQAYPLRTQRPANGGIQKILDKALHGSPPTKTESLRLMRSRKIEDTFSLLTTASKVRELRFGNKIFLYGFLYFSTYCRRMCSFCFYRKPNTKCPRYRKDPEEVGEMAQTLEKSGVHLIDLTMGEDPIIHDGKKYDLLVKLVKAVRERVSVAIMVSPGVLPRKVLKSLRESGADWYALYQETHNKILFSTLRLGQTYQDRIKAKIDARREGLLIEEGILLGVGESEEDRVDSIFAMNRLGVSQVRAMGFIPQEGSPMERHESPPIIEEMKTMAVMRLVHQEKLMPASLDIDGLKGLELRLASGSNVVTSIIPPDSGLAGVAQANLGVDEGLRSVESIRPFIERMGLQIASKKSYMQWVEAEKESQSRQLRPQC
jgi:methylornithine synthase